MVEKEVAVLQYYVSRNSVRPETKNGAPTSWGGRGVPKESWKPLAPQAREDMPRHASRAWIALLVWYAPAVVHASTSHAPAPWSSHGVSRGLGTLRGTASAASVTKYVDGPKAAKFPNQPVLRNISVVPAADASERPNRRTTAIDIGRKRRRRAEEEFSAWQRAPVVIGGTGGSGTRGVVDVLVKAGIYLHPKVNTKAFKECYNGAALDNVCMHPRGKTRQSEARFFFFFFFTVS